MRSAPSAAMATDWSAASPERSSNRRWETRMPLILRTRSPRKCVTSRTSSACNLAAALEVEIAPHGEKAFVTVPLHHVERSGAAEAAIRRQHPAVREIEVLRKQDAQRLVNAEQMSRSGEQVGAVGERLAAPVAGERRARLRRQTEQRGLVGRRQLPVVEQLDKHPRQALAAVASARVNAVRGGSCSGHGLNTTPF